MLRFPPVHYCHRRLFSSVLKRAVLWLWFAQQQLFLIQLHFLRFPYPTHLLRSNDSHQRSSNRPSRWLARLWRTFWMQWCNADRISISLCLGISLYFRQWPDPTPPTFLVPPTKKWLVGTKHWPHSSSLAEKRQDLIWQENITFYHGSASPSPPGFPVQLETFPSVILVDSDQHQMLHLHKDGQSAFRHRSCRNFIGDAFQSCLHIFRHHKQRWNVYFSA